MKISIEKVENGYIVKEDETTKVYTNIIKLFARMLFLFENIGDHVEGAGIGRVVVEKLFSNMGGSDDWYRVEHVQQGMKPDGTLSEVEVD